MGFVPDPTGAPPLDPAKGRAPGNPLVILNDMGPGAKPLAEPRPSGIKHDPFTNGEHSLYSLRHTAICMRIIHSEGQVNIYNLAKNAGTSVDQIERFYARNLPLSAELARNLQSVGGRA